ncbi:MAG: carboxymuconolactone decarboxylase family protein [Planctomycetota bacterium]|jgi:AhpD family alkylhydroperoxidase
MIRALILRKLASVERELGESLDYVRHMLRASLPATLAFFKVMGMANHWRKLPAHPWHVAQIVAARSEDCGPCVQIAVNTAVKAGVPADALAAVLASRPADLPEDLALAYRFAESVCERRDDVDALRDLARTRWGDAGVVELALAISASKVFPVTKRALGYATSCSIAARRVPEAARP